VVAGIGLHDIVSRQYFRAKFHREINSCSTIRLCDLARTRGGDNVDAKGSAVDNTLLRHSISGGRTAIFLYVS
jgi:hypothetical protein